MPCIALYLLERLALEVSLALGEEGVHKYGKLGQFIVNHELPSRFYFQLHLGPSFLHFPFDIFLLLVFPFSPLLFLQLLLVPLELLLNPLDLLLLLHRLLLNLNLRLPYLPYAQLLSNTH